MKKLVFCLITLLTISGCVPGAESLDFMSGNSEMVAKLEAMEGTTPSAIYKEYRKNRVRANEQYKDKWTKVTGYCLGVTEHYDYIKKRSVYKVTVTDSKTASARLADMLQCDFPPSAKSKLMSINEGDKIIVGGRLKYMDANVATPALYDCLLLSK